MKDLEADGEECSDPDGQAHHLDQTLDLITEKIPNGDENVISEDGCMLESGRY